MANPTIKMAPPAARSSTPSVCPLLTLGILSPPSALVGAGSSIVTLPCLGPKCAFFHAAGACSVLVAADALLAQAHAMIDELKTDDTDAASTGSSSEEN